MSNILYLQGKVFGRLTVIEESENIKYKTRWKCRCNCGVYIIVQTSNLTSGGTTSCGCAHRDMLILRNKTIFPGRKYKDSSRAAFNALICDYKNGAKQRNIHCTLSIDVCKSLFNGNCAYCGIIPNNKKTIFGGSGKPTSTFIYNGIDRIDNNKGYLNSNVVSCCGVCNHAKATMTQIEFITWLKRIFQHWKLHGMDDEQAILNKCASINHIST